MTALLRRWRVRPGALCRGARTHRRARTCDCLRGTGTGQQRLRAGRRAIQTGHALRPVVDLFVLRNTQPAMGARQNLRRAAPANTLPRTERRAQLLRRDRQVSDELPVGGIE